MHHQSSTSKQLSEAKGSYSSGLSPAEYAAILDVYMKSSADKPRPRIVDWTKETLYTKNSTILPCNETVSVRVTPNHSDIYILDFVHPDTGIRFDRPGLCACEVVGGSRRKLLPFGVWPVGAVANPLEVYSFVPTPVGKVKYEIYSSSDQMIGEMAFESKAVLNPHVSP